MTLTITNEPACDDVLSWLDAHSVTLSLGVPVQLLHKRWAEAGREPGELGTALQQLFAGGWVAVTKNADPQHLRFTVDGFQRLVEAQEAALAAFADADETADETAELAPVAAAPAPAPVPAAEAAPPAPAAPAYKPHMSELTLRNDILGVYRELRLRADSRLIGMTLSRYWQEMGNRAGDLRGGLDVMVRDGFLISRLVGIDRYWQLTQDGENFIKAPRTADALFKLAPPLGKVQPGHPADVMHRAVGKTLMSEAPGVGYHKLRAAWNYTGRFDENALLLGLDLLVKNGHALMADGEEPGFTMTAVGEKFIREEPPRLSKLMSTLNRVLN